MATRLHPLGRWIALAVGITGAWLASGGVAGAHVEATAQTAPDGLSAVTLSFHHGCGGAATTGLDVRIPEGTTEVLPDAPEGWSVDVSGRTVSWSGGSVPDGDEGRFELRLRLVGAAGTRVFLPTVQRCGSEQLAWIGETDDPEATDAAPRVVLDREVVAETTSTTLDAADPSTTIDAMPASLPDAGRDEIRTSTGTLSKGGVSLGVGAAVGIVAVLVAILGIGVVVIRRREPRDSG